MYKNDIKGYIAITDYDWFEFLKARNIDKANFWTKSIKKISLKSGDLFLFLKKNSKKEKGERKLVGYGIFDKKENLIVSKAWNNYKYGNGIESFEKFKDKLKTVIKYDNQEIGCIILSDIYYFEEPVYLSKINIEFANQIQDGKMIYKEAIYKILSSINENLEYKEDTELDIDFDIELEEGETIKRYIENKKRNSRVRELKLTEFNIKHGHIYCEACNEEDICTIDVHHEDTKVSDMKMGHKTKLNDLRVICASCHRKVHGHNITVDDLKNIRSNKYS